MSGSDSHFVLSFSRATVTQNESSEKAEHKCEGLAEKPVVQLTSSASSVETQDIFSGFQDDLLPEKKDGKAIRFLRHQVFTLYRKLFAVVFLTNLAIFIWYLVKSANAHEIAGVTVANLFVAVIHRQEYVVNAYYCIFTSVPLCAPLWIRSSAARVYHIGGFHSGCGVSGTIWFILFVGQATKEFAKYKKTISMPTLVVAYCIMVLLVGILAFAYPALRFRHHNKFEMTHRFMGWTAIGLVWALTVLLVNDYKPAEVPLGKALIDNAYFWLVAILTVSIILPWLRLRKRPVVSEVLSNHCVRLYFDYAALPPGLGTRISTSPLTEWHSFATIPATEKGGHYVVISRAGDWTSKRIDEPPTKIWVRGIPIRGMLSVATLFRRVLFVTTGSGIAPVRSCLPSMKVPFCVLWTCPDARQTYGDQFVDDILETSPDTIIYNTRAHGKPDMIKLVLRVAKDFQPEAICVISNEKLTRKIVYGMVSRGIPAFGPIWDS
ncbi:hypothetical protein AN958_03727 [Leucoagaricus sp. SymC.cos]|nr:hypothetical protein AN958_03727 [Leucoagaricus sp. SymC.cos]